MFDNEEPHCPLLDTNWDLLYPTCEWSPGDIEGPFNEENRVAIFGLGADKAPGPDGFTIICFLRFWYLVRLDILLLFNQFYNGAADLHCLCFGCPYSKDGRRFYG